MNTVIVNQGGGKYLFEVPANVKLVKGDAVKCDTHRGVTDGVCYADSIDVSEDVAKLIGNLVGAKFPLKSVVGKVVTSVETFAPSEPVCAESAPKQDEPKEPILLYCVKDYEKWLTKGKTYTFESNGKIVFDNGWDNCVSNRGEALEAFRKRNPNMSACLIRAEKRPAKVGEWVVIVDGGDWHGNLYKNGEFYRADRISPLNPNRCYCALSSGEELFLDKKEYPVLPDYVPEKVEPTYYSGKVVCVDNGGARYFEVGKVYQFVGGRIFGAHGFYSSQYETIEKANSRNGVGAKFIEYRGEQSC